MARKRRGLPIDGVLLFDKPKGASSNNILQRVRRLYQAQKAGHTGTLDPMATGLLPICFGEATKFSSFLLEADKVYETRVKLGEVTDTGDAEGEVVERAPVPALNDADIERVLSRFRGEIDQVPPMYSALKHEGRKLYELAREGKTIERAVRRVSVYDSRLLEADAEGFALRVRCSKGTYIRTLAEDIGQALGCGGHITALRRLKTGPFDGDGMHTLDALEALPDQDARQAMLMPVDVLVAHLPALKVDEMVASRIQHGQPARVDTGELGIDDTVRLYRGEAFLGLVTIKAEGEIIPRRLLNTAAAQTGGEA